MAAVDLAAALSQITNEFFAAFELRARRLIAIEIADQTNPQRDVVQIIAVHVTAVDLSPPAIAHFNLPVGGRSAVADHEMVSKSVLHSPKMPMVIIERGGVALTRAAVVDDDELPATVRDRRAIDLIFDRTREVTITRAASATAAPAAAKHSRPKPAWFFVTVFFNR